MWAKLVPERSFVLVIDVQGKMMSAVHSGPRVLRHIEFLVKSAKALGVPVLATEQNPSKLGPTVESLVPLLSQPAISKMSFSAVGESNGEQMVKSTGRSQAILVGVETHICVTQSAFDLLDLGLEVVVCPDALGAQNEERHKLGMERLRDGGILPAHTESVVYEWLQTAEHPQFRNIRDWVKQTVLADRNF